MVRKGLWLRVEGRPVRVPEPGDLLKNFQLLLAMANPGGRRKAAAALVRCAPPAVRAPPVTG